MTPDRWRQIGDLFDASLQLAPPERDAWLRRACGQDDELRAEVDRLLAQDEQADRTAFLPLPESTPQPLDRTGDWPSRGGSSPTRELNPIDRLQPGFIDDTGGFTPKAAIVVGTGPPPVSEPRSVVRARLRELPIIYILILGMATVWRSIVIAGDDDLTIYYLDVIVIVALGGIIALLWSRWPLSLACLKTLELGMIGMLAGRLAIVQYRLMLVFSLRNDRMMAQLTMKNIVLLTSILILTYGLYVPKSWRRTSVVVGPLALLPFTILFVLAMQYPAAMGWLWEGWRGSKTHRIWLFGFDAIILLVLAVGSTFGARTISRLRRQVAEARQLGQYRLRQRIGSGGMGEVYLAEHQLLKRPCALKLIRPEEVADPNALARFEREVQLTATLSHPNTVEVFDYGRTEDGTYYYVMEYLPGLSLAELVERHGPVPPERAVYLLRQVCLALREAHGVGLIHRDVKPSNIFAARRGGMDDVAKLLDFGLVRPTPVATTPRTSQLSREGQILGTPLFMSPEQARGGLELDERSDIYSLGAVAYFLLAGRPPFDEDNEIGVIIAHARDPVIPPSQVRAGIPEDVERVVLRCLAKDPTDRYPDAESLERALGECACAGEWDQGWASRWWRGAGEAQAISTSAS
ncbi:serine/threonine-protein kinase [Singulisphaera acidiphila]|uniref:Serine/threonine protein kinase n=1 Tax=Singulisphaera acidiphila (strain ATCC BAA-1392 / DSM 18658 / VKM B-2454 / MOB10) TaxID=886293 RepID=L0DR98_SINAD|nr:serine/threonine-protein kinase [Singulisphaera acidiphila]AGA31502.1 serine/threonine protein kinase [Singulisphaera acidiphila DSM 18658]